MVVVVVEVDVVGYATVLDVCSGFFLAAVKNFEVVVLVLTRDDLLSEARAKLSGPDGGTL